VNGLLFERGDVTELAEQLRRLTGDRALMEKLRQGIRPVRSIEDEADELAQFYIGVTRQGAVA
jgi:hypothetical protein